MRGCSDTRPYRKTQIAFVYAGDIWLVPKDGGSAFRLTSSPGEESFPRFSPDGTKVAYSASYDGNVDVFVIPSAGGEPMRLTLPSDERPRDRLDIRTASACCSPPGRESGRQRYNQFYTVGLERRPAARSCRCRTASSDATRRTAAQFVYMPMSQDFRNWKRYRGGWAPDLWLFDLKTFAARNITIESGQRRAADVARQHDLLPLRPRRERAQQHLGLRHEDRRRRGRSPSSTTSTSPSRRSDPTASCFRPAAGCTSWISRPRRHTEVPVRVVTDETTLRPRTAKAEPLIQNGVGVADRQARAVRGPRRRLHGAGGIWRGGRTSRDRRAWRSGTRAGRPMARRSRTGAIAAASTS